MECGANIEFKTNRLEEWLKHNELTVKSSLYEIVLNVADVCNRKCPFCPRGFGYKTPHKNPYMQEDVLRELCKQLGNDYKGLFSLSGFGEPFMHPNLLGLQEVIKQYCPESSTYITTNGDFFDANKVLPSIEKIDFSIYSPEHLEEIKKKVENLTVPYNLKLQYETGKYYFNNRAGNVVRDYEKRTNCCNIPMTRINMDLNGDFLICCSDWSREVILGNVFKNNIYDVWENTLKLLRILLINDKRMHCTLCSKCDTPGNLNGNEFKEFWRKHYAL